MGFDILHAILLIFMWHELHRASPPVLFRFTSAFISIRENRWKPPLFPAGGSVRIPHMDSYGCIAAYHETGRSTVFRYGKRSDGIGGYTVKKAFRVFLLP